MMNVDHVNKDFYGFKMTHQLDGWRLINDTDSSDIESIIEMIEWRMFTNAVYSNIVSMMIVGFIVLLAIILMKRS